MSINEIITLADSWYPLPTCTAVQRFARETGDIHSLSAVDLKLLALAHTLEVAAHGTENIREHPVQVSAGVGEGCARYAVHGFCGGEIDYRGMKDGKLPATLRPQWAVAAGNPLQREGVCKDGACKPGTC